MQAPPLPPEQMSSTPEPVSERQTHTTGTGPGACSAQAGLPRVPVSETQTVSSSTGLALLHVYGPFPIRQTKGGTLGAYCKWRSQRPRAILGGHLTCGVRPGWPPDLACWFPNPKPGHAHLAHLPVGLGEM